MPSPRMGSPWPGARSRSTATSSRFFPRASGIADRPLAAVPMRTALFRSLAVIGTGGLILAGVLFVASTVDARAPTVVEVTLTQRVADDERQALITTSLEIVFSEPVDTASAVEAVRMEPAVEGAVNWSGSTMIFTPDDPLELETSYTLTVDPGIRDVTGNEMSEVPPPFEFETAGRPA